MKIKFDPNVAANINIPANANNPGSLSPASIQMKKEKLKVKIQRSKVLAKKTFFWEMK